jgi:lysozyme family protein
MTDASQGTAPAAMPLSPRFLACMPFILKEEGGYSNDPHDSGGMTMHGIIQREYDAYRRRKGLPLQWVKNISTDEQNEIYWTEYWLPHCPNLPAGLDLSFFNIAVNAGPSEATRLLQQALGIRIDGNWGGQTVKAVVAITASDVIDLIKSFGADEENWYRHLSKFKYFGKDWIGRAERCELLSIAMAQAVSA